MWVFCCGAQRSGSTLQYNLVAEIVERTKKGQRIDYVKPEQFGEVRLKMEGDKDYKVFKTHRLTDEIKTEFVEDNARGVYSYRDVRDVIVSLINKDSFHQSDDHFKSYTQTYLNEYYKWMKLKSYLLISRYETFYNDLENETVKIANFLGIKLDKSIVLEVASLLNIESQKKKNKQLSQSSIQVENQNTFDKKSLLHTNHINSGLSHQWRKELSSHQIILIESVACNWLYENEYEHHWPTTDFFLSNSQHGDDYISWQFLGKRRTGLVVEIGAFDGIHLSNSLSLEMLGWKSICIEPNPEFYPLLERNRPKATCIKKAIVGSGDLDNVDFFQEDIGVLSGINMDKKDVEIRYKNRGLEYKEPDKVKVSASTLNAIFEAEKIVKEQVDVLSIDVEGLEMEVLQGLDIQKYQPKLVIVEANNTQMEMEIISYFVQHEDYVHLGNNYQNHFFQLKRTINKKYLRNLNFENLIQLPQRHPKGASLTIQAVPPKFRKSQSFEKFSRRFNWF